MSPLNSPPQWMVRGCKAANRRGWRCLAFAPVGLALCNHTANAPSRMRIATGKTAVATLQSSHVQFRMHVANGHVSFTYSVDSGKTFHAAGSPCPFYFSWWKAARPALFTFNTLNNAPADGWIDVDWVRCRALPESGDAESSAQVSLPDKMTEMVQQALPERTSAKNRSGLPNSGGVSTRTRA